MDEVLKKRRWIVRRRLERKKVDEIAFSLRISDKTVDRWWQVYRKQGWEGLKVQKKPQLSTDTSTDSGPGSTPKKRETLRTKPNRRLPPKLCRQRGHTYHPQNHPQNPCQSWIKQPHLQASKNLG